MALLLLGVWSTEPLTVTRLVTVPSSGSDDATVRVWNPAIGEQLAVLRGHEQSVNGVAFSQDGARIASVSADKTVRIWSASTRQELALLKQENERVMTAVVFNPQGARLVLASSDNMVHVWDSSNGTELITLEGHESPLLSVACSPDGTRIVSGSSDGSVRIWDSLPYRVRYLERQGILAAKGQASEHVDDLWQELQDWKSVVKHLREDTALSEPVRRAALNEVLRRAADHSGS